jgi:hypothetical protein
MIIQQTQHPDTDIVDPTKARTTRANHKSSNAHYQHCWPGLDRAIVHLETKLTKSKAELQNQTHAKTLLMI